MEHSSNELSGAVAIMRERDNNERERKGRKPFIHICLYEYVNRQGFEVKSCVFILVVVFFPL